MQTSLRAVVYTTTSSSRRARPSKDDGTASRIDAYYLLCVPTRMASDDSCGRVFILDRTPGCSWAVGNDVSCGYALPTEVDERLRPFLVPQGLPETDVAVRLFENFRELYSLFHRFSDARRRRPSNPLCGLIRVFMIAYSGRGRSSSGDCRQERGLPSTASQNRARAPI